MAENMENVNVVCALSDGTYFMLLPEDMVDSLGVKLKDSGVRVTVDGSYPLMVGAEDGDRRVVGQAIDRWMEAGVDVYDVDIFAEGKDSDFAPPFTKGYDLEEGWEWKCYDDGSGALVSPSGRFYFDYDLQTHEMKGLDGHYGHILSADDIERMYRQRILPMENDTIEGSLETPRQERNGIEMPEKTTQTAERNERSVFAHVKVPAAFLQPYTYTAKDGRTFEKAYFHIAQGTKVNGIDIGGFSCDVFMNDRMKQQMLGGQQVTLSFKGDEPITIWKGSKDDPENPYQRFEVSPWAFVKGVKAEFDSFKDAKAAERAADREQGVSLKEEAEASRESSAALSGHDVQDDRAATR